MKRHFFRVIWHAGLIFGHEKSLKMSWVIFLLEHYGKKDSLSDTNHIVPRKKIPVIGASKTLMFD